MVNTATGVYKSNSHFTLDVHIVAPATISLSRQFTNVSSFAIAQGDLLGYLVSQ